MEKLNLAIFVTFAFLHFKKMLKCPVNLVTFLGKNHPNFVYPTDTPQQKLR